MIRIRIMAYWDLFWGLSIVYWDLFEGPSLRKPSLCLGQPPARVHVQAGSAAVGQEPWEAINSTHSISSQ